MRSSNADQCLPHRLVPRETVPRTRIVNARPRIRSMLLLIDFTYNKPQEKQNTDALLIVLVFFLMKLYYSAYKVGFHDFILFKQSTDIFTSTTVSTNKTLSLSIRVIHLVHYSTLLCFILLNIMLVLQYHTYKTGTFIMKSYFVMR